MEPDERSVGAHRVVIVGGGFAGLYAARGLASAPVQVTVADRRNHHLFQPLLYQVATGSLAAGEIAPALRSILRRQRNATVLLAEVDALDLANRTVRALGYDGREHVLAYDTLVLAAGADTNYFGHDEWAADAPGLKSIEDAVEIRRRILGAFEAAELEDDPEAQAAWMRFVVVGAGPTGVELAGQIAELAHETLRGDYHRIDTAAARVLLVDAGPHVLAGFPAQLGQRAARDLRSLGIELRLQAPVSDVDAEGVTLGHERLAARTVIWAAGVRASHLAQLVADETGRPLDRGGRLEVGNDLTLPGHPEVFVLGDMARLDGVPGVAPAAMQMGRHAAALIFARVTATPVPPPFRYRDRGLLATIGRNRAVGEIRRLRFHGFPAWALWLAVHLTYLVGFQNRLLVFVRWAFSYLTRGRGARLITGTGRRRRADPPSRSTPSKTA
jgi:NADH dehydrogenase